MTIAEIIENCCKKCEFYHGGGFDICGGELLPVERAIAKNIEGKGLCDKIKEAVKGDNDDSK